MNLRLPVWSVLSAALLSSAFAPPALAQAEPFEARAFYAITTEVGGEKWAITFIVPPGEKVLTNNASKAKVVLAPYKPGDPSQLWQMKPETITSGNTYLVYSKVSDQEKALTGIMYVAKLDSEFGDVNDDKYHDTYNRLTVGPHNGGMFELWTILGVGGDKFTIASTVGVKDHLKEKKPTRYGWYDERRLEAVKTSDGKVKLRHGLVSNAPGQIWTFIKAGS